NPQGCAAGGPAGGAAHEIRADPQPEDRPSPRDHVSPGAPDARGRSDPIKVPIIPLPGFILSSFASRHVAAWLHIRTEKLCYQSQLYTLHRVSRVVYIKWPF